MIRLRVSEFRKQYPGFPHYRPGDEIFGMVVLPFSTIDKTGDPRVFYLDNNGVLPEFQLVAYRPIDDPKGKPFICVARIPAFAGRGPHLTVVR